MLELGREPASGITAQAPARAAAARAISLVVLGAVALLVVGLLAGSLLPSATLAGRLLGSTADPAPSGTYTRDLVSFLGQRLRLSAALLLVPLLGLSLLRATFQDLLRTSLADATWKVRWPGQPTLLVVAATSALALGLRIPFLNQPMRYDEALTFNEFASRPLYYGLSFYPDPNNHLLNTLLVHAASLALGNVPWVLRLPALLAGVLLVPATYALAHSLYGQRAAVASAVLVAVSSYLVEYSTNSRGYTLQTLCFVVMLWLVVVAIRRDSPSAVLVATLVAALGAYALPTMFYGVASAGTWLALSSRGRKLRRITRGHLVVCALVLGLLVTLVYLPVVLISGADKLVANRFVVPLDLAELTAELPVSLARTWALWNRDLSLAVSALLVVGFASVCMTELRRKSIPPGLLAPLVCVAIVLVQRVAPFERVWLFLLPLYFCVGSAGVVGLLAPRRVPGSTVASVGFVLAGFLSHSTLNSGSILSSPETGVFPDAQAVTRTLHTVLATDDAVLTTVPASLPELQYYFAREGMRIDALVRPPAEAHTLFVVTPQSGAPPSVAGWVDQHELQRFPGSVLLVYARQG